MFSKRQQQVLTLVCQGLTLRQIADRMRLSVHTVKAYFDAAKEKLPLPKGQRNRIAILRWADKNQPQGPRRRTCTSKSSK